MARGLAVLRCEAHFKSVREADSSIFHFSFFIFSLKTHQKKGLLSNIPNQTQQDLSENGEVLCFGFFTLWISFISKMGIQTTAGEESPSAAGFLLRLSGRFGF